MQNIRPTVPKNLNPLARELLEGLGGHEEATEMVLRGGVALSHYLEYRDTVDVNAWWRGEPNAAAVALAERCMVSIAARHGLDYRRRKWGETESLELLRGGQKLFSFQISTRTQYLDEAIPAEWPPIWIETLRDNVASKMSALVARGAPRDFTDIYELVQRGIITTADCWQLWQSKNPDVPVEEGMRKVSARLEMIALSRPLASIQSVADRERSAHIRAWFRDALVRNAGHPLT